MEQATLLGVVQDRQDDAILDRAAWVQVLALDEHSQLAADALEADESLVTSEVRTGRTKMKPGRFRVPDFGTRLHPVRADATRAGAIVS